MKYNLKLERNSEHSQKLNIYLSLLIMIDYVYTYIGIHWFHIVEEANPLMIKFFDLPFHESFPRRMLFALIILLFSSYIQRNYEYYNQFIYVVLTINIAVMLNHSVWVYHLLKSIIYN